MSVSMNLLLKEVKDATECPICTGVFSSPKMLPCFHTFCLKCIETYGEDKREGDTLTCPLCRREFKIPVGGLSKLRSNFFLERLITTVDSMSGMSNKAVDCDVCLIGKNCKEAASSFCTECQQIMCDQCSNMHGSRTISRTHHSSPLRDISSKKTMAKKQMQHFCELHPSKEIEFHCQDCKASICGACLVTKHKKHNICEIAEIVGKSKKRLETYSDDFSKIVKTIKKQSGKVSEQLDSFADSINELKTYIMRRGKDIKRMVDKQTHNLLVELDYHKNMVFETFESTQEELQRNVMICDSFKQFCTKIVAEADHAEILSLADELATRAAELNVMPIPVLTICPRLKFIPSDFDNIVNQQNIVGKLFGECGKYLVITDLLVLI